MQTRVASVEYGQLSRQVIVLRQFSFQLCATITCQILFSVIFAIELILRLIAGCQISLGWIQPSLLAMLLLVAMVF